MSEFDFAVSEARRVQEDSDRAVLTALRSVEGLHPVAVRERADLLERQMLTRSLFRRDLIPDEFHLRSLDLLRAIDGGMKATERQAGPNSQRG